MHAGPLLTYAFLLVWAAFVLRGLVTGRMLMRGGDVVRADRPRTYALVMAGNVVALCFVLGIIALS